MHKLSNIMLSGKSTYGSREKQLLERRKTKARMCSQTIHYATKGEITGMIAACNGNFINPGRSVFARERCDNLVWRASQYFQNML